MYNYDGYDRQIILDRVQQFRGQTQRYLAGQLTDEQFLPLRLQNGLYIQRFAPMLRVAIPYGIINSIQLRKVAQIARDYDKGYVHFTTRQNLQLNWPELVDVPDILEELATVDMHAIQTSGNCIRNITTDQFAGVSADEIVDARPWCEIIRQWSTLHPEFAYLPRKFKIAVSGASHDRAATLFHDIGIQVWRNNDGKIRFKVSVGGGLGRTPMIGVTIRDDLKPRYLLSYLEAILRIYNQFGRRDNKYKARIKILVKAMTSEIFSQKVEQEWENLKRERRSLPEEEIKRIMEHFNSPEYETLDQENFDHLRLQAGSRSFNLWLEHNTHSHKQPGYISVTISLKSIANAPGDISSEHIEMLAELANNYSFGEIRASHHQNLILADVRQDQLIELWQDLQTLGLTSTNHRLLSDITCCPGGDYCSLANTKTLPIAEAIQRKFESIDYQHDIGDLSINLSGCMNACAHHHIGDIGILGVDRKGEPFYQVQIGGRSDQSPRLGKIIGPSFPAEEVPEILEQILTIYRHSRDDKETFSDVVERIGVQHFKDQIYDKNV